MTFEQISQTIQSIVTIVMLISGVVGTVWAGVKALRSAKQDDEDRKTKADKEIEDRVAVRKKELEDAELRLEQRIDSLRTEVESEMELKVKRLENALKKSQRHSQILRESGLMLIEAIEEGIKARESAPYRLTACSACLNQDQTLLNKLQEVATLFQKEGEV